jgi:hypothetical protein
MSFELNFQAGMEYLYKEYMINLAAGAELKFPLKFLSNVTLEPYGAFVFPLVFSSKIFAEFPTVGFGAGMQIVIKGGKSSSFFVDFCYMIYSGDAVMYNSLGELYPKPEVIHYQRSVIGIGVGYKYGLFNRRRAETAGAEVPKAEE